MHLIDMNIYRHTLKSGSSCIGYIVTPCNIVGHNYRIAILLYDFVGLYDVLLSCAKYHQCSSYCDDMECQIR